MTSRLILIKSDKIVKLHFLQLGLRDNDLLELPREIGELTRLRELHIQNNRLTVIPPEIANLDLNTNKSVFKMEGKTLEKFEKLIFE